MADGAAAAAPVRLHSYWRSSCSYRVRIALNLKGIPYEYVAVHLVKDGGQQFGAGYTALNPMAEVPTLELDGLVLTQSPAIVEYLEETRPQPCPLLPPASEPGARARVRALCALIACDMQPVANLRVLKHVQALLPPDAPKEAKEAARDAWARTYIAKGFAAFEQLLTTPTAPGGPPCAGRFCVGDAVTMADVFLLPQYYNAVRFGVDLAATCPTVVRIAAALGELPAFAAAHPSAQPDAEA